MELIDATTCTEDELEIQRILNEHPMMKNRLTLLLNGFRELVRMGMEHGADPADTLRSLVKKENQMSRLGIRLLNTGSEWMEIRDELQSL